MQAKSTSQTKASSTEVILIEQLWKANACSTVIWMCQLESWIPSKCEVWCSILLETLHVLKTIFSREKLRYQRLSMLSKEDKWSLWELFAGFDNLSTSLYSMPIVMSCSHRNSTSIQDVTDLILSRNILQSWTGIKLTDWLFLNARLA